MNTTPPTTSTTAKGRIDQIDPSALTVGDNVRTDTTVDKEFVASVKQHGLLQPPMVTDNGDGGYEIVFGHRRVLAAIQAGLSSIDVYLVERHEADTARLVDQLTENDQRQQLTEMERLGGYRSLALLGLSPAQIASRTSTKRERVDKILAVADNEAALGLFGGNEITLDQAALMVEFADDSTATKALTKAATKSAQQFVQELAEQVKKREFKAHRDELAEQLEAEGVIILPETERSYSGSSYEGATTIDRLPSLGKPGSPSEPLEPSDIIGKPGAAARIASEYMNTEKGYRRWPIIQYFVIDHEANGYPKYVHPGTEARELTPAEIEAQAARQAEDEARAATRAALTTASEIREQWITDLIRRAKLPDDTLPFIATTAILGEIAAFDEAPEYLGITTTDRETEDLLTERLTGNPKDATKVLLAMAVAVAESNLNHTWGRDAELVVAYLEQLARWGYELSEVETDLLNRTKAEISPDEAEDQDDQVPA